MRIPAVFRLVSVFVILDSWLKFWIPRILMTEKSNVCHFDSCRMANDSNRPN